MKAILLAATLVLTGAAALAQYSVNWFKIAGGGGTSSGGNYTLSGTIGQADAGGTLKGGTFALAGGFWAAALIQEPGGPQLTMINNGDGTVQRIETDGTSSVFVTLPVGSGPSDLVYEGADLWVVLGTYGGVAKVDVPTQAITAIEPPLE